MLRAFGVSPVADNSGAILTKGGFEKARQRGEEITYLDWIRKELEVHSSPIRPTLHISEEARKCAEKFRGKVLLFPTTHGVAKQWPYNYWVELAWLLKESGIDAMTVMQRPDSRIQNVPLWITDLSSEHMIALSSVASLIISNDSGPAHLGGTLEIPSIAILGATSSAIYAHLPSVTCLSKKTLGCSGCHYGKPFRAACTQGCQELYATFPKDVLTEVQKLKGMKEGKSESAEPAEIPTLRRKKPKGGVLA